MNSFSDRPRIAVIHNSPVHVEISLSLYFILERSGLWSPTLILLPPDVRNLRRFLKCLGVRHLSSAFSSADYEKAIITTSYPDGAEYGPVPNGNHPMLRAFVGRRILVTHRANYPLSAYRGESVLGLTPLCKASGIPFIYACENPALEIPFFQDWNNKVFLVQGKFGYRHRDFSLLKSFLNESKRDFRIRLLGQSASSINLTDDRIETFEGVSESRFYELCRTSHFILPLVDDETRNGQYLSSRFSSTYSVAFASHKPLIVDRKLNAIYQLPASIYENYEQFANSMNLFLDMGTEEYQSRQKDLLSIKQRHRAHNIAVLASLLHQV